jgi:hypothetical protein
VSDFAFLIWFENEPFQVFTSRHTTAFGWLTEWRVTYEEDGKMRYMAFKIGDWESMSEWARDTQWLTDRLTKEFSSVRQTK